MPTPFGISRKAFGPNGLCVNLLFCTKDTFSGKCACFEATAARIEEGRAFYLGHAGVNTEYPHLLSRDLSVQLQGHRGSRARRSDGKI